MLITSRKYPFQSVFDRFLVHFSPSSKKFHRSITSLWSFRRFNYTNFYVLVCTWKNMAIISQGAQRKMGWLPHVYPWYVCFYLRCHWVWSYVYCIRVPKIYVTSGCISIRRFNFVTSLTKLNVSQRKCGRRWSKCNFSFDSLLRFY